MSELEDYELEDEDYFIEDDFEDDSDDLAEQDRVNAVNFLIEEFERENGLDLSAEEWNDLGIRIAVGMTPEEAYSGTAAGRFDEDFARTVEVVEREQGRKLLESEVERMWDAANRAVEDPAVADDAAVWTEARKATTDLLATKEGRSQYIGERLAAPPERQEPSATVIDDDGDERAGFNLDRPDERTAAIDALMGGEDVTTYDDSYTTEAED